MVLACAALLVACVEDREARRRETLIAIQQAFAKRDYEEAYRTALLQVDREKDAEPPEAQAAFEVGALLQGALEFLATHDPSAQDWYRRDLMQEFPLNERFHVGMIWIRKAADLGSSEAVRQLSRDYEHGWYSVPKDAELAKCFAAAMSDRSKYETCNQLEITRGYVTMAPAEQPALPPANP